MSKKAEKPLIKRTTAKLPAELHRRIKAHANEHDTTVEEIVKMAVIRFLDMGGMGAPRPQPGPYTESERKLIDIVVGIAREHPRDYDQLLALLRAAEGIYKAR